MDPSKKELYTAKRSSGIDTSSEAVGRAYASVRDDGSDDNFLLTNVLEQRVELVATGSGGLEELLQHINADDIYYGFIRVTASSRIKFVHLFIVGENVGGMKKGKASLYKNSIQALFEGHGEVQANGNDESTREALLGKIATVCGCAVADIQ